MHMDVHPPLPDKTDLLRSYDVLFILQVEGADRRKREQEQEEKRRREEEERKRRELELQRQREEEVSVTSTGTTGLKSCCVCKWLVSCWKLAWVSTKEKVVGYCNSVTL